jgi:hypothetical protein
VFADLRLDFFRGDLLLTVFVFGLLFCRFFRVLVGFFADFFRELVVLVFFGFFFINEQKYKNGRIKKDKTPVKTEVLSNKYCSKLIRRQRVAWLFLRQVLRNR